MEVTLADWEVVVVLVRVAAVLELLLLAARPKVIPEVVVAPRLPRLSAVGALVVAGSPSPVVAAGGAARPVRGVPAVRLPLGLEVRLRPAGAAEEDEEGAVSPNEREPGAVAVLTLVAGPAENPPNPAAVDVVVAAPAPNPPKPGAVDAVDAAPVESPPNPVAAVEGALVVAAPAENPPNPPVVDVVVAVPPANPNPPKAGAGAVDEEGAVRPRESPAVVVLAGGAAENPPNPPPPVPVADDV